MAALPRRRLAYTRWPALAQMRSITCPFILILFVMYIKDYGHMKMNAAIDAMLKLRLQNGYRADEQQRSTARPPGLYILHLLFICDRLVLSLDNLHDVFLSVYSCCAISYLHANRCCRS